MMSNFIITGRDIFDLKLKCYLQIIGDLILCKILA